MDWKEWHVVSTQPSPPFLRPPFLRPALPHPSASTSFSQHNFIDIIIIFLRFLLLPSNRREMPKWIRPLLGRFHLCAFKLLLYRWLHARCPKPALPPTAKWPVFLRPNLLRPVGLPPWDVPLSCWFAIACAKTTMHSGISFARAKLPKRREVHRRKQMQLCKGAGGWRWHFRREYAFIELLSADLSVSGRPRGDHQWDTLRAI